ncbi:MAG: dUTP diphosphatase [Candidatus Taylorbacteria bacterium]|nr:dUTP diphosphatase [Candidatus Taylorbacteria bacterium]
MFEVKIKRLKPDAKLPSYAHPGDVGLDLYSLEEVTVPPGGHYRFYNGFALEFPEGYAAIVKDKGSISKAGLHTMGGVYDAGFRGEYNVHLVNLSDKSYTFEKGDKVAQLVIIPIAHAKMVEVEELNDSSRGTGQFGSTGKK